MRAEELQAEEPEGWIEDSVLAAYRDLFPEDTGDSSLVSCGENIPRAVCDDLMDPPAQRHPTSEITGFLTESSQNINPLALSSFTSGSSTQTNSFSAPRVSVSKQDMSFARSTLPARTTSMYRHIPSTSLKMAPAPLRPRIEHHPLSYPVPQTKRLSYFKSGESTSAQNFPFGLSQNPTNSPGTLSSGQSTAPSSSLGPVTPASNHLREYHTRPHA